MPRAAAAIADRPLVASTRVAAAGPPRFVGAFSYPLPHVDRHLSDSAALLFGCHAPRSRIFTPSPLTPIAGWDRANSRRRFCPVTRTSMRALVRRAASRTPARSVVEGRGARPCATNEQLVGVGQGVYALPSRKEGIRCAARCGPREAGGGGRRRGAQRAGEGPPASRLGSGQGEERTLNMLPIFVTLDILKLSGWLNADAPCRESKGGHTLRVEVRAGRGGRRRAIAGHAVCRGGLNCRLGFQARWWSAPRTCAPCSRRWTCRSSAAG